MQTYDKAAVAAGVLIVTVSGVRCKCSSRVHPSGWETVLEADVAEARTLHYIVTQSGIAADRRDGEQTQRGRVGF